MNLRDFLGDEQRYRDQIDRLHLKYSQRKRLYDLRQDGVSLASISLNRDKVARLLATTVAAGRYELKSAEAHLVNVGARHRLLYSFCITDRIVHGVVASIVDECMQPLLSPQLYSYRKGTHWWRALSEFARWVREHRRLHKEPKNRGLYVLRRDVHKYTDSIPVHDASDVWRQLQTALCLDPRRNRRSARYWSLIQNVVRPEIYSEHGLLYVNCRGLATGSPISTTLFNLYLTPLDDELTAIPGAFYARYSDDMLFAHADPATVRYADEMIDEILRDRGLGTNKEKDRKLYFNGAGRPSAVWAETRGTSTIPFLGCNVSFEGTVSLNTKKVRKLLKAIKVRSRRTVDALDDRRPENAGPVVCGVINETLEPTSPCRYKSAPLLRQAVTSRRQLKELDYQIARTVAEALSGKAGVRAFRIVPYRTMREAWGLLSLLHRRNVGNR